MARWKKPNGYIPRLEAMGNSRGNPRPHGWRVGNHGYRIMFDPTHPCADRYGYVLEHVAVASQVLGRPLPPRAQVHHINGDKLDNRPANLVICENRAYHMLLHQRQAAIAARYPAHWRRCAYCSVYDDPTAMVYHGARSVVHAACQRQYQRERYARRTQPRKES